MIKPVQFDFLSSVRNCSSFTHASSLSRSGESLESFAAGAVEPDNYSWSNEDLSENYQTLQGFLKWYKQTRAAAATDQESPDVTALMFLQPKILAYPNTKKWCCQNQFFSVFSDFGEKNWWLSGVIVMPFLHKTENAYNFI